MSDFTTQCGALVYEVKDLSGKDFITQGNPRTVTVSNEEITYSTIKVKRPTMEDSAAYTVESWFTETIPFELTVKFGTSSMTLSYEEFIEKANDPKLEIELHDKCRSLHHKKPDLVVAG